MSWLKKFKKSRQPSQKPVTSSTVPSHVDIGSELGPHIGSEGALRLGYLEADGNNLTDAAGVSYHQPVLQGDIERKNQKSHATDAPTPIPMHEIGGQRGCTTLPVYRTDT